jgi:riboflavin synthase
VFTGLIEAVGTVVSAVRRQGSLRLAVESDLSAAEVRPGDSVAVDGVCLTAAAVRGRRVEFDVVETTLAATTLDRARAGRRVNLETAMRLGDRLGGHMVQGHVDGVARVLSVLRRGDDRRARIELPASLARYVAAKGSVAVQGVSLTVASVAARHFEVALVPETLARTTLGVLAARDEVHVEVDLVARYLEGLAGIALGGAGDPGRLGRRGAGRTKGVGGT